jgi:NAD(P)-dependent dehydrogenase (short-subunit alcohol dehydrogenase family)
MSASSPSTLPVGSISGRVFIVTGASRGIGRAVCAELLRREARVAAVVRDPAALEAPAGGTVLQADLSLAADRASIVESTLRQFGRLDGLINNAGVYSDEGLSVEAIDTATLREVFEVNFFAAFELTRYALAPMRQGGWGRIVNVSSGYGSIAEMDGGHPAYRLSKLALNGLTRVVAAEQGGDWLKVNSLCPGWVRTRMGGRVAPRSADAAAREVADLAALSEFGPSGGFWRYGQAAAW